MNIETLLMNRSFVTDPDEDHNPINRILPPASHRAPTPSPEEGGAEKMLQRFAHPDGESGNPLIGDVVAVLEEHGGTAPLETIATKTQRPIEQVVALGRQLKGVFEIRGNTLKSPLIQPKPQTVG